MFPKQQTAKIARYFGISADAAERAAGRINGYLQKFGTNPKTVAYALNYLIDEIDKQKEKISKKDLEYHFQNPKFRKKEPDIIDLYLQGFGAQRISKIVKIPKSTIENFIKKNNIRRENG